MSELSWNPLLGDWTAMAINSQAHTFLPLAEHCPLSPARDNIAPTEVPESDYDIVARMNAGGFGSSFVNLVQRNALKKIRKS